MTTLLDLGKRKNKVSEDGVLLSTTPDGKMTFKPVSGSLYIEIMKVVNEKLKKNGDWKWLIDGMEIQDALMASEVEPKVKR